MGNSKEGGGNFGTIFPQLDVEDIKLGVPDKITLARRAGNKVSFITDGELVLGISWWVS